MTDRARFLVWISAAALVITASLKARTTSHITPSLKARTSVRSLVQDQPPRPVFKTEANYVRVDVFPTLDGEPVPDLTQADFEVLEDRVPQKIDAFERIAIGSAGPQETRREPNTPAESRAMAADPHARVFVIFLDTYHVTNEASHNIRAPLVRLLDRVIGPDDLVGVMTPDMKGTDLTLARRTITIEGLLTRHWDWGRREDRRDRDPEEMKYETCYPEYLQPRNECQTDLQGVAREMILRQREKRSLDGLESLIRHLQNLREERKAIITVSNGWTLWQPDARLGRQLACSGVPGTETPIFIGPGGKLTTRPRDDTFGTTSQCDRERIGLSRLDNAFQFRQILDEANRATATFYTIDPRGLAVFDEGIDSGIGIGKPLRLEADAHALTARVDALRTLAETTDGLAVVNTNDLDRGMKRIVSDLTSYYLLGYYSTNAKLDGKFRSITVRVKRPRVQVRARRGYLAPTAAELAARVASTPGGSPGDAEGAGAAEAHAIEAALAALNASVRGAGDGVVFIRRGPSTGNKDQTTADPRFRRSEQIRVVLPALDASAPTARLLDRTGKPLAVPVAASVREADGSRWHVAQLSLAPLAPGDYLIEVAGGAGGTGGAGGKRTLVAFRVVP